MAREKNPAVVDAWLRYDWPRLKANARSLNATIVFVDESGFLMMPLLRQTLAQRGHTPVLLHRAVHRQKVSVAAALCRSPLQGRVRLFWESFPDGYVNADDYAEFLRDMTAEICGPLIVLQDRAPLHHGEAIDELKEDTPRLLIAEFPTYAPELNPPEHLWRHLKAEDLANFAPLYLLDLSQALHGALAAVAHDQHRLRSFLNCSKLTW